MRLIIARHGETASNRDCRVLGQSDSPLTSRGLATVGRMAEMLASYKPELVFSSTLGRAALTAAIYSKTLGAPLHFRAALAELSCGDWEGRPRQDLGAGMGSLRNTWTERPARGESFADAEPRVSTLIAEIRTMRALSTVLIVGHSAVNRVLLKLWLALEPKSAIRVLFSHDGLYVIEEAEPVRHRMLGGPEKEGLLYEP